MNSSTNPLPPQALVNHLADFGTGTPAKAKPVNNAANDADESAVTHSPEEEKRYTKKDLDNAEEDGYRKGYLKGEEDGRAQIEARINDDEKKLRFILESLVQDLKDRIGSFNQFSHAQAGKVTPLAFAIGSKLAQDTLAENPLASIEEKIVALLQEHLGEPILTITVHSSLSNMLEERLLAHFAHNNDPGEIHIEGSDAIEVTDFKVEWENGRAELNTDKVLEELNQLLATHSQLPPPPTATEIPTEPDITPTERTPEDE